MLAYLFDNYRLLIESIYSIVVVLSCLILYSRARKLYNLSLYKGILYFQDAFLWFLTAYVFRFLAEAMIISDYSPFGMDFLGYGSTVYDIFLFLFMYFLSLGGFFLVYSLVWKDFEVQEIRVDDHLLSRIFAGRLYLLHVLAFIIGVLVLILKSPTVMYVTQLVLIGYALLITYSKYHDARKHKKQNFMQLYFIAMILAFAGYLINFLAIFIFPIYPAIYLYADAVTALIFLIFLYGIMKVTGKHG